MNVNTHRSILTISQHLYWITSSVMSVSYNTSQMQVHYTLVISDNLSRHSPIMLRINVGNIKMKVPSKPIPGPQKPAWYKAKEEQVAEYSAVLEDKIDQLVVPNSVVCYL